MPNPWIGWIALPRGSSLLGFWPLGSGWMLLWSVSAVIPIVLHLWSRRHRQETHWAAMRFLREALEQHAKRMRIEQWLLLLLRVAPLLILGIALADPLAPWLKGSAASSQQVHHVVVVDATYSMGCRSDGVAFERAKAAARELISNARPGDGFTLVRMAADIDVLMDEPVLDSQEVLAEVDRMQLSADGASLTVAAKTVGNLVSQLSERSPHWVHQVIWLSDLTTPTWEEIDNPDCQVRFTQIAEFAAQRVLDVGAKDVGSLQNLAISQVTLKEPLAIVNQPLNVEVVIQSYGHSAGSEGIVTLALDNGDIDSRPLRIPPLGSQTVTMQISVSEPGDHCLELKLDDDSLNVDNQRFHCFRARRRVRSLVVEGSAGAGRMIALAARPTEDSINDVDVAAETVLVERDLASYDCVFLSNVGRLGETEANQLARFVRSGGGLVIFLGDQVQAESYNSLLIDAHVDGRRPALLPARIGDVVDAGNAAVKVQGLDPRDYTHPIVEVFQGHERAGLRVTPVYRSFQLSPLEGSRRVLDLADGSPFFVERTYGQGKCLLVATAASPESTFIGPDGDTPWAELSSWPSFLPLIQQSLLYVVSDENARHNRLVHESLYGHFSKTGEAELTAPDGAQHRLVTTDDDGWGYDETSAPGIYRIEPIRRSSPEPGVEVPSTRQLTQLRSVNVNVAESDLSRIDPSMLPEALPLQALTEAGGGGGSGGARIFRWLLAAVFCLLLMECWVSNRASSQFQTPARRSS